MNPDAGSRDRKLSSSGESMYVLLGVAREATHDEIRRAYRKAALRHHPDKNPDDPTAGDRFREIGRAHYILTSTRRDIYDRHGSEGIYMAETYGEGPARYYYRFQNPFAVLLFFLCGLLTCCYCCCCGFCCCCNFCCGRCRPDRFEEEADERSAEELNEDEVEEVVTSQPIDADDK